MNAGIPHLTSHVIKHLIRQYLSGVQLRCRRYCTRSADALMYVFSGKRRWWMNTFSGGTNKPEKQANDSDYVIERIINHRIQSKTKTIHRTRSTLPATILEGSNQNIDLPPLSFTLYSHACTIHHWESNSVFPLVE